MVDIHNTHFVSKLSILSNQSYLTRDVLSVDFLDGPVGKESACNAGDTGDVGSVPGLERSLGG